MLSFVNAEQEEIYLQSISDQIQVITKDLKTLEKAVYQKSDVASSSSSVLTSIKSDGLNEDIMTKHLLKLNEIENQFRELTNKFEEVNFKLDKLSTRVTKIQSDTQLRFSDLENGVISSPQKNKFHFQDQVSLKILEQRLLMKQQTYRMSNQLTLLRVLKQLSLKNLKRENLYLPDKSPGEQYEFAVSFMKVGDYETAEFALKEFIEKNKDHDLAEALSIGMVKLLE